MEELVAYDPHLVVGILGGSSGTTLDAFMLIHEAQKYGARVALFGRKINHAECQLAFIEFLRHIVDGVVEPVEAVKAYHAVLQKLGIPAHRSLEDDLRLETAVMSYAGNGTTISLPKSPAKPGRPSVTMSHSSARRGPDASPQQQVNFAAMSSAERLAYHQKRINRMFGE